jgi:cytochrome bd-type quinol oxidase subunit 2
MRHANTSWQWLVALVFIHLAVVVVHGRSHVAEHVDTTRLQNMFIAAVIVAGPIAGLLLACRRRGAGGWLVAVTMTGALVFGIVNHFMLPGVDRIDQVKGPSALLFAGSAALLAASEAAGAAAGVWYATRRSSEESS